MLFIGIGQRAGIVGAGVPVLQKITRERLAENRKVSRFGRFRSVNS